MTRVINQNFIKVDWYTINILEIQTEQPFKEGVVYNGEEDVYTIVLNYNLSPGKKKEKFEHAMNHIMNEDFFKPDAGKIEKEAHT